MQRDVTYESFINVYRSGICLRFRTNSEGGGNQWPKDLLNMPFMIQMLLSKQF